jgi:hypothetical protein
MQAFHVQLGSVFFGPGDSGKTTALASFAAVRPLLFFLVCVCVCCADALMRGPDVWTAVAGVQLFAAHGLQLLLCAGLACVCV